MQQGCQSGSFSFKLITALKVKNWLWAEGKEKQTKRSLPNTQKACFFLSQHREDEASIDFTGSYIKNKFLHLQLH